jgi:lipopolysaccharide biosynthesis glycosyltransferase
MRKADMNKIPIFVSSDEKYTPFVASLIASVCSNTAAFVEFYILSDGISDVEKEKINSLQQQFAHCRIEFIDLDMSVFAGFETGGRIYGENDYITLSTYARFLIPELKPEIDRAIFLDPDIIVVGDIKQLWNENLEGYTLGAAPEVEIETWLYMKERETLQLSDQHAYFNAGVLLIDCRKWRENGISKKLLETDEQIRNVKLFKSQEPLNKYFDNNYKHLDTKYNIQTTTSGVNRKIPLFADLPQDYIEQQEKQIVIRHFTGANGKPWKTEKVCGVMPLKNFADFWHYMKMTAFHDEVRRQFEISNAGQLKAGIELLRRNLGNKKHVR